MAKTLQELTEEGRNPCQVCKGWRWQDCLYGEGKDWYSYSEIRYCKFQVLWIISHADTLRAGNWPLNPEGSGYIDPAIHTGYGSEAYYAKPVVIIAEVNKRLSRAGVHGKLLRAEVLAGLDLSEESKSALKYVSGWRRRTMPFNKWLRDRRYLQKKYDKNVV